MRHLRSVSFPISVALVLMPFLLGAQGNFPFLSGASDSSTLYNINVDLRNFRFSGLMLLVKKNDSTLRMVINSEIGPKFIDIELYPSGYKCIYVFPKVNRKRVLRALHEDFGAIFGITLLRAGPDRKILTDTVVRGPGRGKVSVRYNKGGPAGQPGSGALFEKEKERSVFRYSYTDESPGIHSVILEDHKAGMILTLVRL